jgi:hypothetical protein
MGGVSGRSEGGETLVQVLEEVGEVERGDDGTLRLAGARLRLGRLDGIVQVVVVSELGHAEIFGAHDCLVHNNTLGVGALAVLGDRLVLRHACALDALTAADLRLFLHEADRLRRLVIRPPADADVALWACFSE